MTQVVTVHTDFTDLNQMAQGLVGRVNESHVILPGPDPVDVGDWVQFAVTLHDGTPGFAGVGRCVTVVDNGEERLSHQRFDVVIDSLQFDSRGQQVFQHILTLNGGAGEYEDEGGYAGETNGAYHEDAEERYAAAEPAYAEAEAEEASYEDVSNDFTGSKIEVPSAMDVSDAFDDEERESEATVVAEASMFLTEATRESEEEEESPTVPPPTDYGHALTRSADPPATFSEPPTGSHGALSARSAPPPPPAAASVPPAQVNGVAFAYPNGLPFPAEPPRPEIEPSQRVSPAPRPRR